MKRRGFDRNQRISDLLKKELAQMLLHGMADERFRLVTVVDVTVSRDLSYAKVYVTVLKDDKEAIKEIILALNQAAKTMRYQLAREVKLRVMPELKFVYDESTAHGFHISSLIDSAIKKTDKQ